MLQRSLDEILHEQIPLGYYKLFNYDKIEIIFKLKSSIKYTRKRLGSLMNRKLLLSFIVFAMMLLITPASAQTSEIPGWIKNVAGFWSEGTITDDEFLSAIQYLIDNNILGVSSVARIPSAEEEIPVQEKPMNPQLSANVDLITFKVVQLQELTSNPVVIQAVIDSNAKFTAMENSTAYIVEKDLEWKKQPKNKNSPLMNALIENNVSEILKTKMVIPTEEFGDVLFPEIIVTNAYGANVAITGRTDDYNQGDEFWWIKAKNREAQFRDSMWDESAGIFSADIVIRIGDENGNFIGVLNAATPVR